MLQTPESAAIVERLNRLHPRIIDLSLGRIERLLARLDHPERCLPPVVHVAGTNGKGSVVAFMRAIAEAAGQRVHVYTSPHLVRFNERIRVAGRLIDDARLLRLIDDCEAANGEAPITFFEITTALAFHAFAETPADLTLLETGLGGRLDATNVIEQPLATAITSISIDHVGFLGDTLAKIAHEKAGILKASAPCTVSAQEGEALAVIEARARAVGTPLVLERTDWSVARLGDGMAGEGMRVRTPRRTLDLPLPNLAGAHQLGNAAQAIATLDARDAPMFSADAVARGITSAEWPARLQRLRAGPLVERLPAGWELWVDGGHNPGAGVILAEQARSWGERPLDLVFGILNTKDPKGFLAPLAPHVRRLAALTIPDEEASISGEDVAELARRLGIDARVAGSLDGALKHLTRGGTPARILVCGSLYLAGEVLKDNG